MIFLPLPLLYAHGVKSTVEKGGIVVTAQYDTGEAMSYARVKISAPGARLTFQSGRTDRNGRFCFYPDGPGDWEMIVDDEMGHRLEVMCRLMKLWHCRQTSSVERPMRVPFPDTKGRLWASPSSLEFPGFSFGGEV